MAWTTHTLAELPTLLYKLDPDPEFAAPIFEAMRLHHTAELPHPCIVEFRAVDAAWNCAALTLVWTIPDRCAIRLKLQPPMHLEGCYLRIDMYQEHYFLNLICHLGAAFEQVKRVITSFYK